MAPLYAIYIYIHNFARFGEPTDINSNWLLHTVYPSWQSNHAGLASWVWLHAWLRLLGDLTGPHGRWGWWECRIMGYAYNLP